MKLFDDLIGEALALVEGRALRQWPWDPAGAAREGEPNELILRRDMAYELGEGSFPAVGLTAVTQDPSLVPGDEILLAGPDLGEIRGDCAFARVTVIRTDDVYRTGDQAAYNLIQGLETEKFRVSPAGYMMRPSALTNREQVRVSKAAVKSGLTFAQVGDLLIGRYHENRHVLAVKLVFITLPDFPYRELDRLADRTRDLTRTLNHALADVSMDCRACEWKPVCDAVEGMRELHQRQIQQN